ncbi:PREDICTED: protein FAM32A-like [Chrysochloris asiatica]|uniref:Protein FAM32A n=1 Tax=Chrysochloris asiatica TaxID=185453 RepID=A0A9B0TGI0_CHRAS|nr:PREDICTED: protein FAM32A-like [Chrysochloris asiatica]
MHKKVEEGRETGMREKGFRSLPIACRQAPWQAYEQVQKGPLKLKGVAEVGTTKRKKDKDKAKLLEAMGTSKKNEEEKRCGLDKKTPAQVAFQKTQKTRQMERILSKASKTHKQRAEGFNRHPDTHTEHSDIPKVSWTK